MLVTINMRINVEGIILAAGFSSRAGSYKLTLELGGKALIEHCIDGMYDVCSKIIVVGGYNSDKLVPILDKYPKVQLIHNENYESGMFSSVIKGFEYMMGDRVFMIPGDYPLIDPNVYKAMLGVDDNIVIPIYKGKKGHPLLMSKAMIRLLLSNKNKFSNLRDFINSHGFSTFEVDCPGILFDVDTQEDYLSIKKHYYNQVVRTSMHEHIFK